MSPERMGGLAYWASGGGIVGRCGPIGFERARTLLDFYEAAARERRGAGDSAATLCCLRLAVDLARAIISASAWRRAAQGQNRTR
jgi:hypothetical protein